MIDVLVMKGPKRDLSIVKGPKDKFSRRFTANLYTRVLSNGEKCDRDWLVYSKELDKVFCFSCKVFKRGIGRGQLMNKSFSDWAHIGERLREHETGTKHVNNMAIWYELRLRLNKNETIDKTPQNLIGKEKEHWKNVLKRIISIVKFLAKHRLAFRGSKEKLYQNSNGTIKTEIIKKIKQAKYFSVILDCTPDVSHQEQMSLIIRYVNISSNSVSIEESFLRFLNVNDTTGQGLFNVLQSELKNLDLNILNARGQGYDNGSNMK
ncbi:uncharacterized protein LOC125495651 [Beta vulgaris subsp. vulgaris]|uniref:uncharacterized protein LOC125495651 n=1 Tax=Beta vulgaris subsp. vulgaris TaxID=3555 RepID=UPI00203704F8|nr:uncharacterized protein LOC125495651 [Beta vulgaris subsp. vulgaris]